MQAAAGAALTAPRPAKTPRPTPAVPPVDPGRARRLSLVVGLLAVTVVVLDQVTKYLVVAHLVPGLPQPLIEGWLQLRLVRNPGAAFSMATGSTWIFTVVAIGVSAVIVRTARRLGSSAWAVGLGLLLGGAVGNLLDRLFREPGLGQGHVVDFIEYLKFPFMSFPVFNLADSAIVCAAFLLAGLGVLGIALDGSRVDG